MNNLPPCASCVDNFIFENGRKPQKHDFDLMNKAPRGEECEQCYRESMYRIAGIPMPPDYQTFDEAYKAVFAR